MAKGRQVAEGPDDAEHEAEDCEDDGTASPSLMQHVLIRQSPYLDVFHGHTPIRLTIDSGATGNMLKASCATRLGVRVTSSTQSAYQADGSSPLGVVRETRTHFSIGEHNLYFEGLVVENLDSDVLAGILFMEKNDISVRPARQQICVQDDMYRYGFCQTPMDRHAVRRAHILRAQAKTTVWPGEYIELELPAELRGVEGELAVEPHVGTLQGIESAPYWPTPTLLASVSGVIRVPNLPCEPQYV